MNASPAGKRPWSNRRLPDDATTEDVIAGRDVADETGLARVSALLALLRSWRDGPAPEPSPALARLLTGRSSGGPPAAGHDGP